MNYILSLYYLYSNSHDIDYVKYNNQGIAKFFNISNSTDLIIDNPLILDSRGLLSDSIQPHYDALALLENSTIEDCNQNEFYGRPLTVFGDDDRVRVTPTTSYPWRTIVKLYITWGSDTYIGSGVIIDENHVLTAGHCVYYLANGGWADSIKVVPGMDDGNEPYSHAWATNMRCYWQWLNSQRHEHDFAVITLDRDIGLQTGWMELRTADSSSLIYRDGLNIAGYPGDLDYGLNMYWDYDVGRTATEYNHWYYIDVAGGMSGSPVWMYDGTNRYILSICAYGDDGSGSNHGTRIDRNKFDCINNWLTADATSTDKPDLADRGDLYGGFNTTTVGAGLTDLNVWCEVQNLGTLVSGLATVSYYASVDSIITQEDYIIGSDRIYPIMETYYEDSSWSGKFPDDVPSGSYYIGWIIDINDESDEFNENNNKNYVKDYKLLVDATAPSNPSKCNQLNGSTESDVWQDTINDPCFNWSGAFDSHTDVAGYYYYWGTDPSGTSSTLTTSTNYDPLSVSTGAYYLRICTRDSVGNVAPWTTLYTFKYNETLNEDDNDHEEDPKKNQDDNSFSSSEINSVNSLNLNEPFFDISGNEIHVAIWITCGILAIYIHFYFRRKSSYQL